VRFGGRRPSPLAPDPDLIRTLAQLLVENGLTAAPAPPLPGAGASGPVIDPGAVTAPMVGTAYLAPQPGTPTFVRLGETVAAGQPLLIIEAMKVLNEIRAPRAGRIAQILVEDAQPVEYGAVLMLIE
jgi:acetyl-CoA carboxylase biotin carboxyl carrier protein